MLKIPEYEKKHFIALYPLKRGRQQAYANEHKDDDEFREAVRSWSAQRFWYRGDNFPEGNLIRKNIPFEYIEMYIEDLKEKRGKK